MNNEKFEDHYEGWRTLWLTIAGVMAITLATYFVFLTRPGNFQIKINIPVLWCSFSKALDYADYCSLQR